MIWGYLYFRKPPTSGSKKQPSRPPFLTYFLWVLLALPKCLRSRPWTAKVCRTVVPSFLMRCTQPRVNHFKEISMKTLKNIPRLGFFADLHDTNIGKKPYHWSPGAPFAAPTLQVDRDMLSCLFAIVFEAPGLVVTKQLISGMNIQVVVVDILSYLT